MELSERAFPYSSFLIAHVWGASSILTEKETDQQCVRRKPSTIIQSYALSFEVERASVG